MDQSISRKINFLRSYTKFVDGPAGMKRTNLVNDTSPNPHQT